MLRVLRVLKRRLLTKPGRSLEAKLQEELTECCAFMLEILPGLIEQAHAEDVEGKVLCGHMLRARAHERCAFARLGEEFLSSVCVCVPTGFRYVGSILIKGVWISAFAT